ncbi:lysozyme inhibitor LprI family protein [Bacillus sp. CHD6a]|uniref:lysozyme inhibitor LprI family protein n=1 Tax=Bacillus sp. CHD6a TaxID=1643452 RepID=UPI000A960A43|nr:lysozyme inhibitor LprI family protein [Bacillus sp. CHD6a]
MRKILKALTTSGIWLLFVFALTACSQDSVFNMFEGNALDIAVVGETPEVNEDQVTFTEISFDEMTPENLTSYDAVFIRENNLSKASEDQFADVYSALPIPFYFIGTDNFVPFTEKDLEYDNTSEWTPGVSYAVGVLISHEDNSWKHWGFGLHNDIKTDKHLKDMYSRIFMSIDELDTAQQVTIQKELNGESTEADLEDTNKTNEKVDASIHEEEASTSVKEKYLKQSEYTKKEAEEWKATDSSTYALKKVENDRWELWDNFLNEIYGVLEEQLPAKEMDELREKQRNWITYRDDTALAASLKYKGGTQEHLEYVSVLANLTEERCYELITKYMK